MTDWQRQKTTVKERDCYILDNEMYTDCKFSIFGETGKPVQVRCHRVYLAKSSPVFAAMFFGDMKKELDQVIHLPDVNLEAFKAMLIYMYYGDINLTDYSYEVVCGLLYIAKKYLLPKPLLEELYGHLWHHVYPDNMWTALEFAEVNNESELEQTAWEVVGLQTERCLEVDDFQNIPKETLQKLTETDNLTVSEIKLFEACVHWAESEADRQDRNPDPSILREILAPIIPNIRFLAMEGAHFVNTVVPTKILTNDEQCPILCNLHVPNSQKNPEAISCNTKKRSYPDFKSFYVYGTPKNKCKMSKLKIWTPLNIKNTNSVYLKPAFYATDKEQNTVLGVEVPTQINIGADQNVYEEVFTIFILNDKCRLIHHELFSKTVEYNSTNLINVYTCYRPIVVPEESFLKLYIVFHKSGRYPFCSVNEPSLDNLDDYVEVKDIKNIDRNLDKPSYFPLNLKFYESVDDDSDSSIRSSYSLSPVPNIIFIRQ